MREKHLGRARRSATLAAPLLLATALAATGPAQAAPPLNAAPTASVAAPAPGCSGAFRIERRLEGGTTWRMCWHYEGYSALVLDNVSYQPPGESAPIKVLITAKLGQVHVPYDDGGNEFDDLTGFGFAQGLQRLDPAECPGGTIKKVTVPGVDPQGAKVNGLCVTTRARGHAYRLGTYGDTGGQGKVYQAQGKDLLVYAVNKVGWYEYITEWRFSADGTVSSQVGATGTVSPYDYDAPAVSPRPGRRARPSPRSARATPDRSAGGGW